MEDDSFDVHRLQDPMPSVITSYGPSHRRISSTKQCPTQRPVQASLGVGSGHQSDKKVKSSPKHKKKASKKHSSSSSSSDVEIQGVQDRAASSTNRGPSCQRVWNRRGTNPHQEQKTCKLCGVRQVHVYKTGEIIHSRVDPSKIK